MLYLNLENEDLVAAKSSTRRTAEVLIPSMNSVLSFLNFTSEIHEDFQENKLPSRDTNVWIGAMAILFEHYSKPMSTNLVVQARSALSEEVKQSSLGNS